METQVQEGDEGHWPAGKRMYIKEMILENFKSYAGTQRIGPFHKNMSAIIGPNGCGKSNIIDALLFIFGKRAKKLRLNRISELIHNSSEEARPQQARVTVNFAETDSNGEHIPDSNLSVSRIAFQNNSSKYYINEEACSFSEVASILKEKGIDLDNNRFLILQGEVEQIAMMKPKGQNQNEEGLLEFLEDIIGSNQYVENIEEQEKKLESLNDERNSKAQKLKHVERAKDKLEADKAEVEEYLRKERELLEWRRILFQLFVRDSRHAYQKAEQERNEVKQKYDEEQSRHRRAHASLKEKYEEYKRAHEELKQVESELEKAQQEFQEYERRDVKHKEERKYAKQRIKKADEKASKQEEERQKLEKEAQELDAESNRLEKERQQSEHEAAQAHDKVNELLKGSKDEAAQINGKLNEVRKELDPWEVAISEAQARVETVKSQRQVVAERIEENQRLLDDARNAKAEAEQRVDELEKEVAESESELKGKQAELKSAQKRKESAAKEEQNCRQECTDLRGRVEEQKASLQERKNESAVMDAIAAAQRSGSIPGIYGRLGSLGAIDQKYDVAVSTAAPALDYIVVEDAESAQKCVRLLREKNLGVATMLILEKQQHLAKQADEPVEPPKNTVRLYDQVKTADPKLKPAFFYALGNTVVADDMDSATSVAYGSDKRFRRVVTLDGNLIETTGTMSGGGAKPKGGRMHVGQSAPSAPGNEKGDESQLKELEDQLKAAKSRLDERRKEHEDAAAEEEAAKRAVEELEANLPKKKQELESKKQQRKDLEPRIKELSKSAGGSKEDQKELKRMNDELQKAQGALDSKVNSATELRNRVAELKEELENVGGPQVKEQRQLAKTKEEAAESAKSEAAKKEGQAKNKWSAAERAKESAQEHRQEKERVESEMQEMDRKWNELEEEAYAVVQRYKEAQADQERKAEKVKEAKQAYEELERGVEEARGQEVELQGKMEEKEKAVKEADEAWRRWERKLSKVEQEGGEQRERLDDDELGKYEESEVQEKVTYLDASLSEGRPDMSSLEEYARKAEEYEAGSKELERVTSERDEARREWDRLRRERLDTFMRGFNAACMGLREVYRLVTAGGDAELELADSLDPFSEGIRLAVRPPGKAWKAVSSLSGGERTLASLSLALALHRVKPSPVYLMDEVDAALDPRNAAAVAHFLKSHAQHSQVVLVSLRPAVFELAYRLHGVFKPNHQTRSVSLDPSAVSCPVAS